jgi:predicted peptidase
MKMKSWIILVLLFGVASESMCQNTPVDGFAANLFVAANGDSLPYRLFVPVHTDKQVRYPLVLWLHGGMGRGRDNLRQISGGNFLGSHVWTQQENQSQHPAFVLAPQCPEGEIRWEGQSNVVIKLLRYLERKFSIDTSRIYVTGQSLGGQGTWAIVAENPATFAAAVPLCGGFDPSKASLIAKTPVWAFHGDADQTVPVSATRTMVQALEKVGGAPRYTEYKGVGHDCWTRAFGEKELVGWVFSNALR